MNKGLISAIIILLLGGAGTAWFLYDRSKGTTATTAPSTPVVSSTTSSTTSTTSSTSTTTTKAPAGSILATDPLIEAENSKKRYTLALAKAQGWSFWKPNAQFSGLFINFDNTLALNSANEVYVFDTPDDPNNHMAVSIAQSTNNVLRALIPITDYQGTLLPIDPTYWQSNYVDAALLANTSGGSDFMAKNIVTGVEINLMRTAPNNFLYWVVNYRTKDQSVSLTIKMDAKTKLLVK